MVKVKVDTSKSPEAFEEEAEYRIAREGEYYINIYGKLKTCSTNASTVPVLVLKPIKWRAERGAPYYSIHFFRSGEPFVLDTTELNDDEDNYKWKIGNYFYTKEEAEERLEALKPLLLNFFKGSQND